MVTLYRGNKWIGVGVVLFLAASPLSGSVISFTQHLWVLGACLALLGLVLLLVVRPVYRVTGKLIHQLIFDPGGFRYRSRAGELPVPWSDIAAISLHHVFTTNFENEEGSVTYLDFWPANQAVIQRPGVARLWQIDGAQGHFRMNVINGMGHALDIERGIGTFRPDLWRPTTSEDRRRKWREPFELDEDLL